MIWRRSPLLPLLLLVGNVLLVLAIFRVWWVEREPLSSPQSRPKVAVPKIPAVSPPQNISDFRVIAKEDLFSPERQGSEPALADSRGRSSLQGLSLLGVLIIGNERAAIIGTTSPAAAKLQPGATSQVEVVRLGERWNGFTVVKITPEAVVFQSGEGQKTLNFPE